eukprot:3236405-Amphidinium_carterae.1
MKTPDTTTGKMRNTDVMPINIWTSGRLRTPVSTEVSQSSPETSTQILSKPRPGLFKTCLVAFITDVWTPIVFSMASLPENGYPISFCCNETASNLMTMPRTTAIAKSLQR